MLKINLALKSALLIASMRVIECFISNLMSVLIVEHVNQSAQWKLFTMRMMFLRNGRNTARLILNFLLRLDPLAVLQAAGYTVHVAAKGGAGAGHLCCGRTYLASGLVDQAKDKAREVVASLLPFAQKGLAIVGLEPSCLLTLRDEMLVMGLGEAPQQIAAQAMLFEEFLVREAKAGWLDGLKAKIKPIERPVLLHGHCHQKAFGAVPPILEVLRMIPGAQPQLIESSCCGMAGSFGYEAAHHAVSMQMAEAALLPAIRQQPDAVVVADGTSCRHQIADGTARTAIHAARLLAQQLA